MITVIIVDDHEVVRRGLRMTIAEEEDMQLLAEGENGQEAIDLAHTHQPDVMLLDVKMPVINGVEAAKEICRTQNKTHILMLTSFGDDRSLYEAMQAGVTGYLLKDTSGDDLVEAIRGAAQGKPQLHPDIAKKLMAKMPAPRTPVEDLTRREKDVLRLLATGHSNREIGSKLSLSETTIKGYVSTILSKLGVQDRTQAALLAVRYGVVGLGELPMGLGR